MACYCRPSADSRDPLAKEGEYLADEDNIVFEKRSPKLASIFTTEQHREHRIIFEDWTRQHDSSERNLSRKQENCRSARADLYQILGLFFVFQGVILTAVAQANLLTCHNWILPFFLCLLTSIFAFGASVQKLKEINEFTEQLRLERAYLKSLNKSIEGIKENGTDYDIRQGQPELEGPYTGAELSGKGSIDHLRSAISRFCNMWIISYAGAVLLLLFVFSGVTLFSVHQILCNPGMQKPTGSN